MTTKKERLTDEELLAQFEGIGEVGQAAKVPPQASTNDQPSEADLFEELGITERPKPTSRPHTPRIGSTSTIPTNRSSPKRQGAATPPSTTRTSEEKPHLRKSGESSRSFHTSFTPATDAGESESQPNTNAAPEPAPAESSGGGWWGGIFATASAAVKQAEALAKEIQHNEEAQRWAEQVKGNVGALRGLGIIHKHLPFVMVY